MIRMLFDLACTAVIIFGVLLFAALLSGQL